jgi:hypothetical protein
MGYDYSLAFLSKHHQLVLELVKVAQTGEVLSFQSEHWEKIRQRHQLVRSVLANMAHNMPEWKDIRTTIRTWTEHTPDKQFKLLVGSPAHKVTGRPPAPASVEWREKYVSTLDVRTDGAFVWPTKITTDSELREFVEEIPKIPEVSHTIRARFESPGEAEVAYLNDLLNSWGWKVVMVEGENVQFRRIE